MRLLLVGCGHLGQTMLRRWLVQNPDLNCTIIKPSPLPAEFTGKNLAWHTTLPADAPQPDIILYAVRPQQLADVLPAYRNLAVQALNISVAAGWPLAKFTPHLGAVRLVRTMPNLPAQIGQGVTPAIANAQCTAADRSTTNQLFSMIGRVVWLEAEQQMDAATALSGSGPAYVFYLAAAMREAGIALGLSAELASDLARATVQGAGNYLAEPDMDIATLYRAMLLPGGTTEAAFTRLLATDGLQPIILEAMQRAAARAAAIGKS
ncbi:MAG: pyrroline-5-carboxylate reductase [Alphaproteobacteria bacterium]|nr:pyrroline-5-carboxylate reductase [Alphaproteobacteria bacterium]